MTQQPSPDRNTSHESGVALIMAVFFAVVTLGLIASGTLVLRATQQKTDTNFQLRGQAAAFAGAGLTECLGWFRRQANQAVLTFSPVRNTTITPPILDTDDAAIGLVREFEISGAIWGRYEAWKQWDADPDPARLAWRKKVQVSDVSTMRQMTAAGTVWRIRSVGYVYRRVNPSLRFNQAPNAVLAMEVVESEIRRLSLTPPGAAALCTYTGAGSSTNTKVKVLGGTGAGIFYRSAGGAPTVAAGSVTGAPALSPAATYNGDVLSVFGVNASDLRSLADDRVMSDADVPSPLPTNWLIYIEAPTVTFDSVRRLEGHAAVYVKGDVVIDTGSNSFFTGLLYVDGKLTINAPAEFNGTIVTTGTVTLTGVSDFVNVSYDSGALNALRRDIGQYRMCGPVHAFNARS